MPTYGMLTNPSNEILSEINKIYELNFEYVEVGIEGSANGLEYGCNRFCVKGHIKEID